jgi:hypothetical protein
VFVEGEREGNRETIDNFSTIRAFAKVNAAIK